MKFILHVGTHKTGTSSIQRYCGKHQRYLESQGVYWPRERFRYDESQHSFMARAFAANRVDLIEPFLENVRESAVKVGCDRILLSGERFSVFSVRQAQDFKKLLGADMEVVVYFRNLYDYVLSTLGQLLEVRKYHLHGKKVSGLIQARFNYTQILNTWEHAVGADNVSVYSYDEHKRDIVTHFLKTTFGMEPEGGEVPRVRHNKSMDLNMIMNVFLGEFPVAEAPHRQIYPKRYLSTFPGKSYATAEYYQLARLMIDMIDPDISHPRLQAFSDKLTSFKEVEITDEERKTYFLRFAKLIQDYYGEK
ncbi:hypothetical protein [Kordiimonas sp.]|uniref:hypothetical protein n=1 Tax=Kordiimonas sp. TaxID=1970157 RepID=UPI003A8E9A69